MNRRTCLKTVALGPAASGLSAAPAKPIQLHVDLDVDPAREKEMLANFRTQFRPTISKQPGFVEVKLLKFQTALAGQAPAGMNYRLLISFQTEEQRKTWAATPEHQKVWPTIEKTLRSKYSALLFDVA